MITSGGAPYRKTTRLPDFDYSAPANYYVTICAYQNRCLFGKVIDRSVILSPVGLIIQREWLATPGIRPDVILDEFCIMPNHVHLVFKSGEESRAVQSKSGLTRAARSLGSLIGQFKSTVTKCVREMVGSARFTVWQDGFYDHVVRDTKDLERIRRYVRSNPERWQFDRENPSENPSMKGTLVHPTE